MPRGNGMGPMGQGPMSGRGAGFCAGNRYGYGMGQRFGGRGFGFQARQTITTPTELTADSEKNFLQNRVEILARELENAKQRLIELNAKR